MADLEILYIDELPKSIKENTLYISEKYKTCTHICPCGCSKEIPIPIRGKQFWNLSVDGGKVSLSPSILNRSCKAHYFIRSNKFVML